MLPRRCQAQPTTRAVAMVRAVAKVGAERGQVSGTSPQVAAIGGGDFPAVAGARGGPKRAVLAAADHRKRPTEKRRKCWYSPYTGWQLTQSELVIRDTPLGTEETPETVDMQVTSSETSQGAIECLAHYAPATQPRPTNCYDPGACAGSKSDIRRSPTHCLEGPVDAPCDPWAFLQAACKRPHPLGSHGTRAPVAARALLDRAMGRSVIEATARREQQVFSLEARVAALARAGAPKQRLSSAEEETKKVCSSLNCPFIEALVQDIARPDQGAR